MHPIRAARRKPAIRPLATLCRGACAATLCVHALCFISTFAIRVFALAAVLTAATNASAAPGLTRPPPGESGADILLDSAAAACVLGADFTPPIAIKNIRLIQPGGDTPGVTIVIDGGRFSAIGRNTPIPTGAQELDASGLIAYPGFIDSATSRGFVGGEPAGRERTNREAEHPDPVQGPLSRTTEACKRLVHPAWNVLDRCYDAAAAGRREVGALSPDLELSRALRSLRGSGAAAAKADEPRKAGFTTALVMPADGLLAGRSAVLQLGDLPLRRSILRNDVALHGVLAVTDFSGEYPGSLAGAVALFRQTLLDAQWQRELRIWAAGDPKRLPRVPFDGDLDLLARILSGDWPLALIANDVDEIHRALDRVAEFRLKPILIGGAQAWKAAKRLKAENVPLVVSLALPPEPKTPKAGKFSDFGLRMSASSPAPAPSASRRAQPEIDAPLFDEDWEGQPFDPLRVYDERKRQWQEAVDNLVVLQREGVSFGLTTHGAKSPVEAMENLRKIIERGLPPEAAINALTLGAAMMLGVEKVVGRVQEGYLANLVVMTGSLADKEPKTRWVFVEGRKFDIDEKKSDKAGGAASSSATSSTAATSASATQPTEKRASRAPATATASSAPASQPGDYPSWSCEIEADRKPEFRTGGNVLIRHVNVVTVTDGDKAGADILVRDGRIIAIGWNIPAPPEATVLELRGYFVCPGIIDCHSHMALSGGANESTQSVVPEVRMSDVVNYDDLSLYRALAGGVTMIHTMHGSADTVGGQCVVLRLKWGRPSSELIAPEAHKSVKFALGENVKRSNGPGNRTRFPASRMGVETTLRRSFEEARRYRAERERVTKAGGAGRPVRRDLRLDALNDIMDGAIWVHSHCYRADEILRLLQVAEDYGFRVGVLQHVLEGYRIIPEILRHGCAASTFSDWWTYKMEAADAIPQNAGRMLQAGIVATVNSDSGEVTRHLPLEAAKSVRFAGLSVNDALRLATLNGAITLGIADRFGSIQVGKAADLAIFDGHPLDTFAKCVMTLIDGEVYFQHNELRGRTGVPSSRPAATANAGSTATRPAGAATIPMSERGGASPTSKRCSRSIRGLAPRGSETSLAGRHVPHWPRPRRVSG